MKIVFLNVWDCKVEDKIKKFIKEQSIDTEIFCLQEAHEKTKWLFRNMLSEYGLFSDYKCINNIDNFPQVTYVRKDIEILSKKSFLKNTPKTGLALHLQIKYKNKIINICNVHGISVPGDKMDTPERILQSQKIIDLYKNLSGSKIIGGDFNLEVNTKSINLFEKNGYVDLIKKYKIPTTRNRLIWDEYPDSKQYFSDYIFVDPNVRVNEFLVPNIEISDHLPMILKFKDN